MTSKLIETSHRLSLGRIEHAARVIDPVFRNSPQFENEPLSQALGVTTVGPFGQLGVDEQCHAFMEWQIADSVEFGTPFWFKPVQGSG